MRCWVLNPGQHSLSNPSLLKFGHLLSSSLLIPFLFLVTPKCYQQNQPTGSFSTVLVGNLNSMEASWYAFSTSSPINSFCSTFINLSFSRPRIVLQLKRSGIRIEEGIVSPSFQELCEGHTGASLEGWSCSSPRASSSGPAVRLDTTR